MKKQLENYSTTHTENALGHVHKILINSALVSAQNRNRYYWTSFKVEQPEDKGILLKDIIESGVVDQTKSYCVDANYYKGGNLKSYFEKHRRQLIFTLDIAVRASVQKNAEHTYSGKCPTVTASMGIGGGNVPLMTDKETAAKFKGLYIDKDDRLHYRKLTPRECMRLQTIPERHIDTLLNAGISNTQLYKMTGNGWTVDVIVHILKAM